MPKPRTHKTATWIKADGTSVTVQSRGKTFQLDELQKMVGGDIQLVSTRHPAREMYIDEEGLVKDLPINSKASELIDPKWLVVDGVRGDVVIIEQMPKGTASHEVIFLKVPHED